MLIDIDKIVVGDRIRKDFGDIQELADDIKENTLLNALVVTPSGNGDGTYLLIAGERRLRACKMLDYKAVPVNTVGVDDAEQALMMEISENECRKEFTKTERLEYARRLAQLEKAKSEQGKRTDLAQDVVQGERNRAANAVAQALGTNRETLRQDQFIADNADLLDPADFAEWDEGKLSTNKAFQKAKAAQKKAEQERNDAKKRISELQDSLADALQEVESLEKQNDELYELANNQQVVEHEVVREVVPKDYEDLKRRTRELENGNRLFNEENAKLREQIKDAQSQDTLGRARGELARFSQQYRNVTELASILKAIDEFLGA